MRRTNWVILGLIVILSIGFACLSYFSALTKNPTGDEPLHAVAGFAHARLADFRIDAEDPPLFEYWAMIPQPADALKIDTASPTWAEMLDYLWRQYTFVIPTLYHTDGVDPDAFVNRSRVMMTILGVALAGTIAWFAWEIAGPWAALIATAMFCFDPNFLGHAPLIKNDVPLSLILCALSFALWRAGQRLTIVRAMTIALLVAAALTVKFSGVLLVLIAVIILLWRGLMSRPWLAMGRIVADPLNKFGGAFVTIALIAVVSYAGIWACYGFRYSPTPGTAVRMNTSLILRAGMRNRLLNQNSVEPTDAQIEEAMEYPPLFAGMILDADDHQLLPQAWLAGLLDTWATTQRRPAFLLDQTSYTGWFYYFPLAMLFKTPVATIGLFALACVVALRMRVVDHADRFDHWTILCIFLPIALYALFAITSNLNLGVRHMLPIYPLLYVWIGAVLAPARPHRRSRIVIAATIVLLAGLVAETVAACPNYVAFFNIASGGSRGGLHLLGDSNLDWGQDLKTLAKWQAEHPNTTIYLDYFGGVDPGYYVKYKPLFATDDSIRPATPLHEAVAGENRVLAISATKLQGIYPPAARLVFYQEVQRAKPIAVLGGTIYIYQLPLD